MNSNLYRVFAFFSIAASLSLASCDDNDHSSPHNTGTAVTFSPSVGEHGTSTRAVDGTWTGNEAVGIAMLPSGSLVTSSAVFRQYNVAGAGATSALTPAGEEHTLYYPGSGDDVNFAAFSPYTAVSGTSVTYAAFADQSEQASMEAVDFLYHKGTTDYNKTSTDAVELDFNHKLSKVVIQISVDDSSTNDIDLSTLTGATVSNLPASVTIDLADASLTAGTDAVTTALCKKDGVYHYEAIVVPHEGGAGNFKSRELTLSFETLGDFSYTLSDELDFMSGNIYTLPFRLSKLGLEQVGDASITNWASGTITWDSYTLSSTDGPFSIAKGGETKSLSFTTTYPGDQVSASVAYTSGSDWLEASTPKKGNTIADGVVNYTCEFTVDPNAVGSAARSATITITVDKVTKTFTVNQVAGDAIELVSTETDAATSVLFAPNEQKDQTLNFQTNYEGTVTAKLSTSASNANAGVPAWTTNTELNGSGGSGDDKTYAYTYIYTLTAYTGNNTASRKAYLHVDAGGKKLVYTIEQTQVIVDKISSISEQPAAGGSASFTFETNYSDATPSGSATGSSWITGISFDDGTPSTSSGFTTYTCSFTLGSNIGAGVTARSGEITLSSGGNTTKNVTVTQAAIITEAASNSYILTPTGNTIYIPVSRANEHAAGAIGASDVLKAEFLWADNSTLLTELEAVGMGSSGAIKVTSNSSSKEGNAVIAVKVDGVIKWSWHIWVTGYKPSGTWMDRNLGATSADKSATESARVKTFGLFYQWGRKDPFPRSAGDAAATGTEPKIYRSLSDASGTQYAPASNLTTSQQTYAWSVANPTTFVGFAGSWFNSPTPTTSDNQWGATGGKTIYDPCPAGYRVPVNGSWGADSNAWSSFTWDATNKGRDTSTTYGGWYPAAGRRDVTTGALGGVGAVGYCWSASPYSETNGYSLYSASSAVYPSYNYNRTVGFGVRCSLE